MGTSLTFVLGGARSGKSTYAEKLASENRATVLYVATGLPLDGEMAERVAAHRASRPKGWRTVEAPQEAGKVIREKGTVFEVILLDCLTLLASNVICALPEPVSAAAAEAALEVELKELIGAFLRSPARWIVVSNEVGLGIVPDTPLGRVYRDALGRANQRLADLADTVNLMVAGIPVDVKRPKAIQQSPSE